jgi:hypothetical protein
MNNSKKSASDSQLNNNAHGGDRERDGSNDSAASNNTVASAVVNSIWNGASAVGNYVWSFWGSPQSTTSELISSILMQNGRSASWTATTISRTTTRGSGGCETYKTSTCKLQSRTTLEHLHIGEWRLWYQVAGKDCHWRGEYPNPIHD